MSEIKSTRDFLLILLVIYYSQGSLYAQGSLISKVALALVLGISVFYFIKTLVFTTNKGSFYIAWSLLLILNTLGYIFTGVLGNPDHFSMFKGIMMASLPFYPFYYFSKKNVLQSSHLIRFFIVMLPITILQFFLNAQQILSERVTDNTDLVNNVAYSFVALIPFVFLFKRKKIIAVSAILILIFFIIQGAKRGALISGAIGLLFFVYLQLRMVNKKKRFRGYLFVVIAAISMSYYAYTTFQNNQFLISRVQSIGEGDGSGRLIIYANIINNWYNGGFLNHLFGFGFAASLELSGIGNFAHNDWLELLSNFGILGVCIYFYLFSSAARFTFISNWKIDKKVMFLTIILIWFFITLVSMSYTNPSSYIQAILLAYLVGSESKILD